MRITSTSLGDVEAPLGPTTAGTASAPALFIGVRFDEAYRKRPFPRYRHAQRDDPRRVRERLARCAGPWPPRPRRRVPPAPGCALGSFAALRDPQSSHRRDTRSDPDRAICPGLHDVASAAVLVVAAMTIDHPGAHVWASNRAFTAPSAMHCAARRTCSGISLSRSFAAELGYLRDAWQSARCCHRAVDRPGITAVTGAPSRRMRCVSCEAVDGALRSHAQCHAPRRAPELARSRSLPSSDQGAGIELHLGVQPPDRR